MMMWLPAIWKKTSHLVLVLSLFFIPVVVSAQDQNKNQLSIAKQPNFSVEFEVSFEPENIEQAAVTMNLAGADELEYIKFIQEEKRYQNFTGSGSIEKNPHEILWLPKKLFGAINYTLTIPHRRSQGKGFDSYASPEWVLTRMDDFFPDLKVGFIKAAQSLTRVHFNLPAGWRMLTVLDPAGDNTFKAPQTGKKYNWPTGWAIFGRIDILQKKIAGTELHFAKPYVVNYSLKALESWVWPVVQKLKTILPGYPNRVLIVIGDDPMWRGGLSGESSLYLHKDMPLLAKDHTSTVIHELFHLGQKFEKDKHTGEWIVEGLAEYYSLKIPHQLGYIDEKTFKKGLRKFVWQGRWGKTLERTQNHDALYNSAPYIHYLLDEKIKQVTDGRLDLDNIVVILASSDQKVGSQEYLKTIESATETSFGDFFQKYVEMGEKPE